MYLEMVNPMPVLRKRARFLTLFLSFTSCPFSLDSVVQTMANRTEYLFEACICTEFTIFIPESCAACCGSFSDSLTCCLVTRTKDCICKGHNAYDKLVGPRDDVICICCQRSSYFVKPLCLTGEKPVYTYESSGWCCSYRRVAPRKKEVVSKTRIAECGLQICEGGECAPKCCTTDVKPIQSTVFGGVGVPMYKVKINEEYILCAAFCCMTTMFIPETEADERGCEGLDRCLCCETDFKIGMAPETPTDYAVYIDHNYQHTCLWPTTCCKGMRRISCMMNKYAFPCDGEVPFSIACCGLVFVGESAKLKSPAPFRPSSAALVLLEGGVESSCRSMADQDVTLIKTSPLTFLRLTVTELSREEEKLAASKDYSGAAKLNDEAKTLSSLAAAVEELEVRERSLAVAKDYTGAQAANEETNALILRALAEVDRIRRASLGGEYTTPNPLGTSFLSQQHGVPVAVADAINGAPESTEMER